MSRPPLFSVLIPTFNRGRTLDRVLRAWEDQQPRDLPFELVLIDDGSTDETPESLASVRSGRYGVRRLRQPNQGPAAARNRGLEVARGPYILFTGDDIEPAPDLLEEHLKGHSAAADPTIAILGLTRWPTDTPVTATMRHVDGVGAQQFSYHWLEDGGTYDFRHFYTSNISVDRSLLDREPDGFAPDFPAAAFEDAEFADRLTGWGLTIRYRASALAFHHHPYDVRSFFARQRRCGHMAALLWERRPALAKWLSIRDLDAFRVHTALLPPARRARITRVAAELSRFEGHALALAGLFDDVDPPPKAQDDLLWSLFTYAFLKGLIESTAPDAETAERDTAAALIALLPRAARAYRENLAVEGLPCPAEDTARLIELG